MLTQNPKPVHSASRRKLPVFENESSRGSSRLVFRSSGITLPEMEKCMSIDGKIAWMGVISGNEIQTKKGTRLKHILL